MNTSKICRTGSSTQTLNYLNLQNGVHIAYRKILGDPDKPYLVFLHEGLGCIQMWKHFPQQLCASTGCPGIVYERQGYGHSSPLSEKRNLDYHKNYADYELLEVISSLIQGAPYFIIGHSDGGTIGLVHASGQPTNLLGLITEAAHVFVEVGTIEGIKKVKEDYAKDLRERLRKYHGDKTDQMFYAWSETWLSGEFLHWDIQHLLPRVVCPLYAIQGRQDQFGTEKQIFSIVEQVSGPVKYGFIDDCAHSPHHEQQELVLEKMEQFINSIIK